MKITIHANQIEWQTRYADHVMRGLQRHGHNVTVVNTPVPQHCDIAVIMGPNAYQKIEKSTTPFIMLNRKLIGNDQKVVHENCSISWNGFNGNGTYCVDEINPKRLDRYMKPEEIEDWKTTGDNILVIEQSNTGRSIKYKKLDDFYKAVSRSYNGATVLRKKPIGEEKIKPMQVRKGLITAKAIANLNSTISIEALAAGIPVVSFDVGDPAYAISSHDLNDITYPDNRLEFFQYLAHCQWHESEIRSGEFWENIYPITNGELYQWDGNGS